MLQVKDYKRLKVMIETQQRHLELWIAFNFVSLLFEQQLKDCYKDLEGSCELLSILYLCSLNNNHFFCAKDCKSVVNCFQFCIFALWTTTIWELVLMLRVLWIAFNFVSLLFEQQREAIRGTIKRGCELLSILYLCSLNNNFIYFLVEYTRVVNCFQFCIFALWTTTHHLDISIQTGLWIAFNFVSLLFEQQQ